MKQLIMGLAKTEIFTDKQNQIAIFAKAFGHPARVAILQRLFKMDTCYCGDLVNEIGLAQPTINNFLELCFKYDPEGRSYVLNLLPIVGGTMTLTLLIFIGYLIFSSKKEKNNLETVVK